MYSLPCLYFFSLCFIALIYTMTKMKYFCLYLFSLYGVIASWAHVVFFEFFPFSVFVFCILPSQNTNGKPTKYPKNFSCFYASQYIQQTIQQNPSCIICTRKNTKKPLKTIQRILLVFYAPAIQPRKLQRIFFVCFLSLASDNIKKLSCVFLLLALRSIKKNFFIDLLPFVFFNVFF